MKPAARCLVLALACCTAPAFGQAAKNVRFLVGAPAGGSNDIFARAIGQREHGKAVPGV